ncbi:MAG TPA: phosphatidylglycerol lysyltransferase domain-containing protein [Acidimicrobiales bacterium]|nr:phosphatidylglycerol lysyltransferase domain-containing protein [Acidimicrobiales bacterium]
MSNGISQVPPITTLEDPVTRIPAVRDGHSQAPTGVDTVIDIPIGRRVMVVSDLLLTGEATASTLALTNELARTLDAWNGPGILIIAGNLFDLTGNGPTLEETEAAMRAHPKLREALTRFLEDDERRVMRQTGTHEPGFDTDPSTTAALADLGVERAEAVDLILHTAAGARTVRVEPGEHAYASPSTVTETEFDPAADAKPGAVERSLAGKSWRTLAERSASDAPWFEGLHRLSDPSALSRFVTSRLLYRRLGRYAWWLLVPFAVAIALKFLLTPTVLRHAGNGVAGRTLRHVHAAGWGSRLSVAALFAIVVFAVLALALGLLSRRVWSVLGGGTLNAVRMEGAANDTARDGARLLMAAGHTGLITAATFQPELTNLAVGFYANVGATTEVVEEQHGRLGLPPVFIHRRRLSWVELETGADLHVRLLYAESDIPSHSLLERLVSIRRMVRSVHPTVVASYPKGDSWPPAPDLRQSHRRTRRVRRLASAAILVAGLIDLLDAITPPMRARLHVVLNVLPLRASELAGALVALAGMGLLALGRGVLRGQRRAWRVCVTLLTATLVLHLVAGGDVEESLFALGVLIVLLVYRRDFQAASDWSSLRSAIVALVGGAVAITVGATISIQLSAHFSRHHRFHISWVQAYQAAAERMIGIRSIPLPNRFDRFFAPSLLVIGIGLVGVALFLLSRPVVDRRLTTGRAAEFRARDIVRRHGQSTLDYFALRSDKQWFFFRDSLVAYAIYGGICLISPDPIGPRNEREQVWGAFRRFADDHGWVPAIMGAGEEWLPVYNESGMHNVYIGDEAVVDTQQFSLAGGGKKGLRQAHNRIKKYGYTVSFHDPSRLDQETASELISLMGLSRRGDQERGFSMMLGRIFDPRDQGLLLTVVHGPDGRPAAMCQFVPATGINGYSLDLMRRDPGEHPNGLLDFALCSTIEHLKANGYGGLSLNFAALRSTLAGEKGDSTVQRAERWFLKRISSFAQIETLWRFNAKYDPDWLPRYVAFDTAEHLVPVIMAILRAESLWEIPVLGRLLAVGAEKRMQAARRETDEAIAESLGAGGGSDVGVGVGGDVAGADCGGAVDGPSVAGSLTNGPSVKAH